MDAAQRAHQKANEFLAAYERPPLDPAVEEALREYVDKKKGES
jgi:trimethylamine--corrinoid protein Co-methyltransferase